MTNETHACFALPRGFVREALHHSTAWLTYEVGQRLADHVSPRLVFAAESHLFDFERFGRAGKADVRPTAAADTHEALEFNGLERGSRRATMTGWFDVRWDGEALSVLRVTSSPPGACEETVHFIVAESASLAERFFDAVCRHCADRRGVVWVYSGGGFRPSHDLYAAIQSASWGDLVLSPPLEAAVTRDFKRFLGSKALYARYGAPFRRGALFVGPPGNGKTHAIRALLKEIDLVCLYVKSLKTKRSTEDDSIADIFEEARDRSPCVLVLEDLDAIITDETRSVFLNELDGFARNEGVVTIATTNHPERLDPALLERPSRFDRKYLFDVPAHAERARYLKRWATRIEPELRPSDAAVERATEDTTGFSFAYLQELTLASLMRWVELKELGDATPMDRVLGEQLTALARELRLAPKVD